MAYAYIRLKKKDKNNNIKYKNGYFGSSFWSLISPIIVSLVRKNYTVAACLLIVYQIYFLVLNNFFAQVHFDFLGTSALAIYFAKVISLNAVFVFCYNQFEISILENSGYVPCSEEDYNPKEKYQTLNVEEDEELRDLLKKR